MLFTRKFVFGLFSLAAMTTILLVYRPRLAVATPNADGRAVYDNDTSFQMLSGAARSVLEAKFGKKQTAPTFLDLSDASLTPVTSIGGPLPPNVIANNRTEDTGSNDTQSETSTVVSGQNVIIGFNDSEEYDGVNPHFTGWANSTTFGGSFTDHGPLPLGLTSEGDAGDPALAINTSSAVIFLATLGFNTGTSTQIFSSTDGGNTFNWVSSGTPAHIGTTDFIDKEWLTVDNNAGTGRGNIYQAFRVFPAFGGGNIGFNRSIDGGSTFTGEVVIANAGSFNVQGANVLVGNDHSVYVFWLDQSAGSGTANKIKMRKSTDGGVTFGAAITIATLNTTGVNGDLGLKGGFRSNAFPQTAVNPVNGDLYVIANDFNGTLGPDILMWRSHDGGVTWVGPARVNDDSTSNNQFMPSIAASRDGTKIGISWYDRRSDANNSLIERWAVAGGVSPTDGSITFRPNFRISSGHWPVIIGQDPVINSSYMGDYDTAAAGSDKRGNNFFFYSWGDNRLSDAAHLHQPDVRSGRVSCCIADLALTNSAPGSIASGSNLTYTITYNNSAGPDAATSIVMSDVVPTGTTFVSVSTTAGNCLHPVVGGTGIVKCSLASLAQGAATVTITLVVNVTAASGTIITDTAKLTEVPFDATPDVITVSTNVI